MRFFCDMKRICRSCVLCATPFQCCYHEFLLTQRECNFGKCFFTRYCPHANLQSFQNEQKRLESLNDCSFVFQNPATRLPSPFVPEIMPMRGERERALSIIKDIDIPVIAVSLQNLFYGTRETPSLRQARKRGLHDFLDYSGEIVLTTDVKDRLCDRFLENPSYFKTLVEKLDPEYLTTFDTYTYSNIPACIARVKMQQAISSSHKLVDLNCKIIGLSLGATPDQVYDHVGMLYKLGCRIIAHPVYEFRKGADTYSIRWRIWIAKKLRVKAFMLSCGPGSTARMRVYANYYSSWSWFSSVNSRDRNVYEKRKAKVLRMVELAKKYSKQACL